MTDSPQAILQQIIAAGKQLNSSGLVSSTGGNLSVKTTDGILVTATGSSLDRLTTDDIVLVDPQSAEPINPSKPPTCEATIHLACYKLNQSIRAIVHCHPVWTIGVVSGNGFIPPMFLEFIDDVETIGYVDFMMPSSSEMAQAVSESLKANNVCIMRNHGLFAAGQNITQALNRAIIVEDSAKAFAIAKTVGQPQYLTPQQIDQINNVDAIKQRRQLAEQD